MNYLDLTDAQVLDMVGVYGPGFIGAYLFERAEWVRQHNPNGAMGPDAVGKEYVPSEAAMQDLAARGMVVAVEAFVGEGDEKPVKRGPGRPRKGT